MLVAYVVHGLMACWFSEAHWLRVIAIVVCCYNGYVGTMLAWVGNQACFRLDYVGTHLWA